MRRSGHTDDEIAFLLTEAEGGIPIDDICRAAHVSLRTFYRWRKRLGGLNRPAVERLTSLEDENRRLRRQLAYLMRLREYSAEPSNRNYNAAGVTLGRFSNLRTGGRR